MSRFLLLAALLWTVPLAASARDASAVKAYLVETVTRMQAASGGFVEAARQYAALTAPHGGDPAAAFRADPQAVTSLHERLREGYKAMDSFGYETVEGIVGGVPSLSKYDLYLDAGLPRGEGNADEVAPVTIQLSDGSLIDREGAPFTYLIEPALWGSSGKYTVPADLDGDGNIAPREALPTPGMLTAVAADVDRKIGELLADAKAWQATATDFFGALVVMTPTLSDYFEDWKESRYTAQSSGRFFAVSRVSDMRGIMQSCAIMYEALTGQVAGKDEALARALDGGFRDILAFLERLEVREKKDAAAFTAAEIDELAAQAQSKTDKLVPQIKQAAALLEIPVSG